MWNAIGWAIAVIGVCLIFRKPILDLFPRLKNIGPAYFSQKGAGPERDLRVEAEALLREGLKILAKVKRALNLPVLSDVHVDRGRERH